jgi:hypothetical protein
LFLISNPFLPYFIWNFCCLVGPHFDQNRSNLFEFYLNKSKNPPVPSGSAHFSFFPRSTHTPRFSPLPLSSTIGRGPCIRGPRCCCASAPGRAARAPGQGEASTNGLPRSGYGPPCATGLACPWAAPSST